MAETAIMRAWAQFYEAPSAERRARLEEALEAQAAIARRGDSGSLASLHAAHTRMRRRADEHAR